MNPGHQGAVWGVCFHPIEPHIATCAHDGCVMLWSSFYGAKVSEATIVPAAAAAAAEQTPTNSELLCLTYTPLGEFLVSGAATGQIHVFAGSALQAIRVLAGGHQGAVYSLCFSSDGVLLASSSADHTALLWNFATGDVLHRLVGHTSLVTCVRFNKQSTKLLSSSKDKMAILWDVGAGAEQLRFSTHSKTVRSICFYHDDLPEEEQCILK
jgi:WD40 repeat protein